MSKISFFLTILFHSFYSTTLKKIAIKVILPFLIKAFILNQTTNAFLVVKALFK